MLKELSLDGYAGGGDDIFPLSSLSDDLKKEYWATLALCHCAGLGVKSRAKLLKHYGNAFDALENKKEWVKLGFSRDLAEEMATEKWRIGAKKEWDHTTKLGCYILLWRQSLYPRRLRELPDPPALLYCKGEFQLLKSPCLAIVGSRRATPRSLQIAAYFAKNLSNCGISIVSGMALGIDKAAHEAALEQVGKTIGVLGTGIDQEYPAANSALYAKIKSEGLLITEFSPGTPPGAYNFPIRNRIISGLSLGVLVVEAAERSGSLITAKFALEQNRDVFAVPGLPMNTKSLGCQNLLRQGARPAFNIDDILNGLAEELRQYEPGNSKMAAQHQRQNLPPSPRDYLENTTEEVPPLTSQAKSIVEKVSPASDAEKIMAILVKNGPMQADDLARALEMPANELNTVLVGMEIMNLLKRMPGAIYAAIS